MKCATRVMVRGRHIVSCRDRLFDLSIRVGTLAGLGSQAGQAYLAQWPRMKLLLDAAHQSVLGHGFEPLKPDRFHQLYEIVAKRTSVSDASLPQFPALML